MKVEEKVLLIERGDEERDGRKDTSLNSIILMGTLYTFAIALTLPTRPALILRAVHEDTSSAAIFTGVILAAQSFISVLSTPFFGSLSDTSAGRIPILMISIFIEMVSLIFLLYFQSSLYGQFFAYILMATADSTMSIIMSAISDLAQSRTKAFAKNNACIGVSIAIGPLIGGIIIATLFLTAPIIVSIFLLSLSFPFLYTLQNTYSNASNLWNTLKSYKYKSPFPTMYASLNETKALSILSLSILIASLGENGVIAITYLYFNKKFSWDTFSFALYVSMNGILYILCQCFATKFAMYFGEKNAIVIGYFFSFLHCLLYAIAKHPAIIWIGLCLELPMFASLPSRHAVLAQQVDSDKQGALQGSIAAIQSVGKPFASLSLSAVFAVTTSYGFESFVFYPISLCFLLASLVAYIALSHPSLRHSPSEIPTKIPT